MTTDDLLQGEHHYFVSSVYLWRVGTDLLDILPDFARAHGKSLQDVNYLVWLVPAPLSKTYAINMYMPQVDGAMPVARGVINRSTPA